MGIISVSNTHTRDANFSPSGVRRMLDRAFRAKPPPTAIIAPAKWTLVALFHLAQQGILAGQHYACVARDDDALLDLLSPSVARYGFDPVMFARRLFAATMRLTQHRHVQDQVRLLPQYLPGDSVDCQGFGKSSASR